MRDGPTCCTCAGPAVTRWGVGVAREETSRAAPTEPAKKGALKNIIGPLEAQLSVSIWPFCFVPVAGIVTISFDNYTFFLTASRTRH